MTKKRLLPIAGLAAVALTCLTVCAYKDKEKKEQPAPLIVLNQWQAPPLPATMAFAGEAVPMNRWEIKEQFDHELTLIYFSTGNVLYMSKLAQRWFPLIEERLKANNIPDDFKYLCVAESNLQNLISKVGATGFWQFMPATAPNFGLEVSNEVDERYDVLKSTDAACKFFKQAYDKLGSWTAAAASYNCGQGGYNTQVLFQKQNNYYDLLLPEETNRYIFRILTYKYLMQDPKKMGYTIEGSQTYGPYKLRSLTVTKSIANLAEFATANGATYKMLKICNPWLRSRTLTVKAGKEYVIKLP